MRIDLLHIIILILVLILNSLFIFGILKIVSYDEDDKGNITDKMILWRVRYWFVKHLGVFYSKPVVLCAPCMSSIYGTLIYWGIYSFTFQHLFIWPFYCLALCGLNTFMQRWIIN